MKYTNYFNHFFGDNTPKKSNPKPNHREIPDDIRAEFLSDMNLPPHTARMIDLDDIPDDLPPEVKVVFDKIKTLRLTGKLDNLEPEDVEKMINSEFTEALGEPSEEHITNKNGISIAKRVWDIGQNEKFAQVTKSNIKPPERTIDTVVNELEIALENEDYESAVKLREEMRAMQQIETQQNKKKKKK